MTVLSWSICLLSFYLQFCRQSQNGLEFFLIGGMIRVGKENGIITIQSLPWQRSCSCHCLCCASCDGHSWPSKYYVCQYFLEEHKDMSVTSQFSYPRSLPNSLLVHIAESCFLLLCWLILRQAVFCCFKIQVCDHSLKAYLKKKYFYVLICVIKILQVKPQCQHERQFWKKNRVPLVCRNSLQVCKLGSNDLLFSH